MCVPCAVRNITVKYGDTITLHCTASSNVDVKWTQTDTLSHIYDIYSDGAIFENIRNRFSITSTVPSQHNLVMLRANTADAGRYVCDERNPADGSRTVLSRYFLFFTGTDNAQDLHLYLLVTGPFYGAIAVPSVTHCRCRRRWCCCGHRRAAARSGEWAQHVSNASCVDMLFIMLTMLLSWVVWRQPSNSSNISWRKPLHTSLVHDDDGLFDHTVEHIGNKAIVHCKFCLWYHLHEGFNLGANCWIGLDSVNATLMAQLSLAAFFIAWDCSRAICSCTVSFFCYVWAIHSAFFNTNMAARDCTEIYQK